MKNKLLASFQERLISEVSSKNPVSFLKNHLPLEDALDAVIATVFMYTRSKKGSTKAILMTEVVCAAGHSVRDLYKLKKDSALAAKTGAFLLYSFEALGLLKVKLGAGTGRHQTYVIEVLDEDTLVSLWESVAIDKTTKLPSLSPYEDWTGSKHVTGTQLVKTNSIEVLKQLTPTAHPLIFEAANRAQQVGWNVNKDIFSIYTWALKNKTDAFSDIWDMQSQEAKASKVREAVTVGGIAKKLLDKTFYHMYTYDFRCRRYVSSAYFHEQGTDLSKGLLLYAEKKAITEKGFYWLLISIASNWAGAAGREDKLKTDKLPLADRVIWALENETAFIAYATAPKKHQGWMYAEKPWQFLAACNELKKLREFQSKLDWKEKKSRLYDYPSGLIVYIDGSNNGAQHLTALSRDETTAPLVNLVPSAFPGDLYKYVADHVWLKIQKAASEYTDDEST